MTTTDVLDRARDIHDLIRLLDHQDPDVQWRAADRLGTLGEPACDPLLGIVDFPRMNIRLGAIEALGDIRCPRAVMPLVRKLGDDPGNEVRFVAALALGQIGDRRAEPALEQALHDPDRYVRYGAATALRSLGWTPDTDEKHASVLIACQEWEALRGLKGAASAPLIRVIADPNPKTREKVVELLGENGSPDAVKACRGALMDRDPGVRWQALHACKNCKVPSQDLPCTVAARERTGPNPAVAGLLNFLFLGTGYEYLGRWWGSLVSMVYMTILVLAQIRTGSLFPYLVPYPVRAFIGIHTYFETVRLSDR